MADKKENNDEDDGLVTIKLSLRSIVNKEFAARLKQHFFERSVAMTHIAYLASLLFLFKVNSAQDATFFQQNGEKVVRDCFSDVTYKKVGNLPQEFRNMVEGDMDFEGWPGRENVANGFEYFVTMYITNIINNLVIHCECRLRYFLRMECYKWNLYLGWDMFNNIDVLNTIKDVMKDQDWTNDNAYRQMKKKILLRSLTHIGFPPNVNIKYFVKDNWFKSIWMFLRIQRDVEQFLIDTEFETGQWNIFNSDRNNNLEPTVPRPPKVKNFTVVPLCDYKLKHTRFDQKDCYALASKWDLLPKHRNPVTRRMNRREREYYNDRKDELWNLLFNMDKIRRIGKRLAPYFHFQIVTDGTTASVLFKKPKKESNFFCLLMVFIKYMLGYFVFEIGVDPGDKTWIAGVRRNIQTKVEVSKYEYILDFRYFVFEYNRSIVFVFEKNRSIVFVFE